MKIENGYDFLSIADNSGYELAKLTDTLNEKIDLADTCIDVHFTSDEILLRKGL